MRRRFRGSSRSQTQHAQTMKPASAPSHTTQNQISTSSSIA